MRQAIILLLIICLCNRASSQLMAGASIGIFNIPGSSSPFKGLGPTIKVEYIRNDRVSIYLDGSLYNKEQNNGTTTTITDEDGMFIGEADTKIGYSIRHVQLGFKGVLGSDFSEKGFSFLLGGGGAASFVRSTYKHTLPGYNISDSRYNSTVFGFHFIAGAQYNFDPIIVELKSSFDLMLKPITDASSYIITSSRLGVLIPLTK